MINIRYHIVSIIAVFLALGIGTALGSTFLDQTTVSVLEGNISSAETRIDATNGENDRLRAEVDAARARDQALVQDADVDLLGDRLSDVPVLVVVAPGVETELLDRLRATLTQADADLRGTLELGEGLDLADDIDPALAESVGFEDVDAADPDDVRREVYDRLDAALAAAGSPDRSTPRPDPDDTTTSSTSTTTSSTSTTTTTAPASGPGEVGSSAQPDPDGETPDIVTQLLAADLLRLAPGPGRQGEDPILETTGYRFVFVAPPTSEEADHDVVLGLLPTTPVSRVLGAVVVSSTPEEVGPGVENEEPRPAVVASIRGSEALASRYSTVDNVETFGGLVATVRTLEVIDAAEPGHWGQGDGATAILPPGP